MSSMEQISKALDGLESDIACVHEAIQKLNDIIRGYSRPNFSEIKSRQTETVPKAMAHLTGEHMEQYLHDMQICQIYAEINRRAIAECIVSHMHSASIKLCDTVHNYISFEENEIILRKGAVSSKERQVLVIPMNMRDGTLLCVGKGNPEWNCSAPHGAGRIMSRAEAKAKVDMEAFKASMDGIYTTSVCEGTKDESPMTYKPMDAITSVIEDSAKILDIMKPVYNFKASES